MPIKIVIALILLVLFGTILFYIVGNKIEGIRNIRTKKYKENNIDNEIDEYIIMLSNDKFSISEQGDYGFSSNRDDDISLNNLSNINNITNY